jgi:hypothetical protein
MSTIVAQAVVYLLTIGEEDEPGSGLIADLDVALGRARVLSERVKRYAHWCGADVRVWEAAAETVDPTLERMVARFEDGRQVWPAPS